MPLIPTLVQGKKEPRTTLTVTQNADEAADRRPRLGDFRARFGVEYQELQPGNTTLDNVIDHVHRPSWQRCRVQK
jgi:hypothetical protein